MSTYYSQAHYSLRDQYRMGSSAKLHRSGRPHRKFKPLPPESFQDFSSRPYITDLPPEIQLSIFDHLDPVASTCLGLSSKKLYPVHRSKHKKVSLFEGTTDEHVPLCLHLRNWAPPDLVLDWETEKLVSRERHSGLQRERERKYWEAVAYNAGYTPQIQSSRHHHTHQPQHERWQPRLRKSRRMERHDIWTFGRRLRSWGF